MNKLFTPRQPGSDHSPETLGRDPLAPERRVTDARNERNERLKTEENVFQRPDVQKAVIEVALKQGWVKYEDPQGTNYKHYVGTILYVICESDKAVYRLNENNKYMPVSRRDIPDEVSLQIDELSASTTSSENVAVHWERRKNGNDEYDISGRKGERRYLVFLNGLVLTCPPGSQTSETLDLPYPQVVLDRRTALRIGISPAENVKKSEPAKVPKSPEVPTKKLSAKRAPETAPKSSPTPETIVQRFRSLQFKDNNGTALPSSILIDANHFRRNNILNLSEYQSNMLHIARSARDFTSKDASAVGAKVSFDGSSFTVVSREGVKTIFTSVGILNGNTRSVELRRSGARIRKDTEHIAAARYDVYVQGNSTEYVDKSGALKIMEHRDARGSLLLIEYFTDSDRPSLLNVLSDGARVVIRSAEGTPDTYTLSRGLHFVPERGAPIPKFERSKGRVSQQERDRQFLDAADIEATKRYADNVASTLKTPQAITAFVTSNFDFVSRMHSKVVAPGDQNTGAVRFAGETGLIQDAQHPLRTIYLGAGDCEDFALVIKYLCDRAKALNPENGASSFVAKTHENHYAAYTVEEYLLEDGTKAYTLCKMHTIGFERQITDPIDGTPYRTSNEALSTIWRGATETSLDEALNAVNTHLERRTSTDRKADIDYRDALSARLTPEVREFFQIKGQIQRQRGGSPQQIRRYAELGLRIDWGSIQMMLLKPKDDINGPDLAEGPAAMTQNWSAFVKKVK